MKKILSTIIICLAITSLKAQSLQDPAVNDAMVAPNPASGIGSQLDVVFTIGNNGIDDISGADANNRITFVMNLAKCAPSVGGSISTIGTNALSGPALSYFDITYNSGTNRFTATQKNNVAIIALESFELSVHVQVTQLSAGPTSNTIGANMIITPNPESTGFNDTGNDNGEAMTHTTTTTLPVELVSFTAANSGCDVRLDWKTASEEKFSRFVIEYSADGRTFGAVKTVAASNSPTGKEYNTIVNGPDASGYYRLKMVDIDGAFTYSKVALVRNTCSGGQITITANPVVDNKTTVKGLTKKSTIMLFDANGKKLTAAITSGPIYEVDFSNFPSGMYSISVLQDNSIVKSFKVIKP